MVKEICELWKNKREPQGRLNITLFFANIFLMMSHIFFMVVYVMIGYDLMIILNSISLLTTIYFFFNCYKKSGLFIGLSFFEIWIHMIIGTITFGWNLGFQNWSFAMITAYFLPAFSPNQEKRPRKQSVFYALTIIISYFLLSAIANGGVFELPYVLDKWMKISIFMANNAMSFFTIVMFALFYTSYRERKVRELTRKADYDELTGLYNRYALLQISSHIVEECKHASVPYSVAIFDLDHFKSINDTYGHASGDDVLRKFAGILRSYSIKGIIPGRWGGEEFVMIAPPSIPYNEFLVIIEKLRVNVENRKFEIEDNQQIPVTVSIGAEKIQDYSALEKAVSKADINLYKAKESGRNKVIG